MNTKSRLRILFATLFLSGLLGSTAAVHAEGYEMDESAPMMEESESYDGPDSGSDDATSEEGMAKDNCTCDKPDDTATSDEGVTSNGDEEAMDGDAPGMSEDSEEMGMDTEEVETE